jgi:hypothetical protein
MIFPVSEHSTFKRFLLCHTLSKNLIFLLMPYSHSHFLVGGATSGPGGRPWGRSLLRLLRPAVRHFCIPCGLPWSPGRPVLPSGDLSGTHPPLPRCAAGNCPDSHSGGGTGLGVGGGGVFVFGGFGAAWVGMTDSSRARLLAGSPPAPSVAMCCISFWAASPSPCWRWRSGGPHRRPRLAPSTVLSSCKGDSSGPKNPSIFRMLASAVRSPAAAASLRHFSDPEISVKNSGFVHF